MKKENKIIVAVSHDQAERRAMVCRLAIQYGFALTASQASTIITRDIYDINLAEAYFILCDNYSFAGGVITTQRLYELAARGICVIIACRSIPREYQFICSSYIPSDFDRL